LIFYSGWRTRSSKEGRVKNELQKFPDLSGYIVSGPLPCHMSCVSITGLLAN
jgi:hypothetical protein